MTTSTEAINEITSRKYAAGFVTDIEQELVPPGLDESVVRLISAKKDEPEWMLDYRLKAFRHWLTLEEPEWAHVDYPKIDFQAISYHAAPKEKPKLESLDEVDPELLRTYEKLGIPLHEQKLLANVAVDANHRRLTRREMQIRRAILYAEHQQLRYIHTRPLVSLRPPHRL